MKRFLIVLTALILGYLAYDTARYYLGWYIDLQPDAPVSAFMSTDAQHLYMDRGAGPEEFTVKGVNLGVGIPGEWATDYAVSKETYLRWFAQMQEMGANTVRVYITLHDDFYNAFYEYNTAREEANEEPLWLIHGVWVNDYIQNSHRDAYDKDFLETFVRDGRTLVDVLHGNKKISLGRGTGSGFYTKDVSRWVIGYILGVEWEDVTVTYTNHKYPDLPPYQGTYLSATEDASAFESMLAQVGDRIVSYESRRYKTQRLVAFSNWPTTDPFLYPEDITTFFMKCAQVDVEHIRTEDAFLAGQFASYHVYPYYPDYLNYILNPAARDYDSLADFIFAGDYVELKLPWQLLNFSDPSRMTIHDDYYENYGVDYITIDTMYLGLTDGAAQERTPIYPAALKGWGNTVSYHERLKPSYYILQKLWQ